MDTMKKAMYLGLGALSITKEKAEAFVDDLVKRGKMSEKDRDATVEKLLEGGEKQEGLIEEQVFSLVQRVMAGMGIPTQKDLKSILNRLDGIEKKIGAVDTHKEGTES